MQKSATDERRYDEVDQSEASIIEIQPPKFYPYYIGQKTLPFARLWFQDILSYCIILMKRVTLRGNKLHSQHLPEISPFEDIHQSYETNQEAIKQQNPLTWTGLAKIMFFGELRSICLLACLSFIIEQACKNSISLVLSKVISEMVDKNQNGAAGYIGLLLGLNLLGIMGRHHGYQKSIQYSSKARMVLINLIYEKITDLSAYSVKEAYVGKILNLISGDISVLEYNFIFVFQCTILPLAIIFGSAIMWTRFNGPIGILALTIIFIAYPIQMLMQYQNGLWIKEGKSYQDSRLKLTNEFIEGIRLIKMYAWEDAFRQMIHGMRSKEFRIYLLTQIGIITDRCVSFSSQMWASVIFFVIVYFGDYKKDISVGDMIATIQLLSAFKFSCVFMVSYGIQAFISIKISFDRIANVINMSNQEMTCVKFLEYIKSHNEPVLELQNFSAYWTKSVLKPVLQDINLKIQAGEVWGIIGKVGSGKSTLLSCFLFEIPNYQGSIRINGNEADKGQVKFAYVEQEPFIFPESIRNNILFGRPYNRELYQQVIHVSCLEHDIIQMKFQDHTEIGEKGINLSGGQRARLSLARALYQQADVYLFDDPLSAVDASVARNIFHMTIKDFIKKQSNNPVVLLVTHQVQYALECDKVGIFDDGKLIAQGPYQDIRKDLYMVSEDLAKQIENQQQVQKQFEKPQKLKIKRVRNQKNNLIGTEESSEFRVTTQTYLRYFKNWNMFALFLIILLNAGSEIIYQVYYNTLSSYNEFTDKNQAYYRMIWLVIGLLCNNYLKYLINTFCVLRTSNQLHTEMIQSLSRAPVSYFDTNPSGRIINRFSNDLVLADTETNITLLDILEIIFGFTGSLITLSVLQPYFIILLVAIYIIDSKLFLLFKPLITQMKEIELIQRSPLFDFLNKTLGGVIQVRAFQQQQWFREQFLQLSNKLNMANLSYYYVGRAFGFYIEIVGFFIQLAGFFLILHQNGNNLAIFAQSILLLTTYNDTMSWGLRQMITFETQMNSYNRIFQIIDIPPEAPHHIQNDDKNFPSNGNVETQMNSYNRIFQIIDIPPEAPHHIQNDDRNFPSNGNVNFENIQMRYRKDTDLVLKGLSFSIETGQKIGCVGRTGAGKSSILQVIFRMAEIEELPDSRLEIAGVDIRKIGLHRLRSNIGIIPQSPFLFSGTIRRNLDPLNQYKDDELWKSLEETDLKVHVEKFKGGLNTDMSDVNSVFSVGQKQLICLARTILTKRKIIVLDEATANVDMKTDDFIQDTIKTKFHDCTIITIAHRLNTIADYDKVMVVSDGKVLEFDTPFNLLGKSIESSHIDQNTEFSRLVKNTGDQNSQAIFEIAKKKFQK